MTFSTLLLPPKPPFPLIFLHSTYYCLKYSIFLVISNISSMRKGYFLSVFNIISVTFRRVLDTK